MIDEIQARNLALIAEATIRPSAGMTVITGETGAGKTALLASCRLLMGQRADRDMVRQGEPEAEVQGRLFLPPLGEAPEGHDPDDALPSDAASQGDGTLEREVVVDRRVTSDGRSHVRLNGRMASVTELSDSVAPFVSLCSQHDQQMLAKGSAQRRMLDAWAGVSKDGLLDAYREAFSDAREARHELEGLKAMVDGADARVEDAVFKLRQIDAVDPSQEDYDELRASLLKAENAEMLARTSNGARGTLSDEGGVLDGLNGAIALLDEGARADESLGALAATLREATYAIEDVAHDVSRYAEAIDLDVGSLDRMQERASAYSSLLRSFGPTIEDVCAARCEAQAIVDAHEDADGLLAAVQERLAFAEETLRMAGNALHEARVAAIPALRDAIGAILERLEMAGAKVSMEATLLPRDQWSEAGPDAIALAFQPSAGMQPRPLSRIASGGELSRVMLALHVALGDRDEVPTLVFDEVDAGVGGAAAVALAEVLADVAATHQVIVVTHLAQVAAKADAHYVASKALEGDRAVTTIAPVEGEERTREIARMLSGTITESSLEHARELQSMPRPQ